MVMENDGLIMFNGMHMGSTPWLFKQQTGNSSINHLVIKKWCLFMMVSWDKYGSVALKLPLVI